LNSLKANSINSWLDFSEVFIRNFNSTYKRPPQASTALHVRPGPNRVHSRLPDALG
jgi:hypothetical protein